VPGARCRRCLDTTSTPLSTSPRPRCGRPADQLMAALTDSEAGKRRQ
jgi:hypothetical protein